MNSMMISLLFSGHGFGINTNLFETNVINLSVVVTVVIVAGGDALRDLLTKRKQKILDNFALADERAKQLQDKMNAASKQLEQAKKKQEELEHAAVFAMEKRKQQNEQRYIREKQRLSVLNLDMLCAELEKAKQRVADELIELAAQEAHVIMLNHMGGGDRYQGWVNGHKMQCYISLEETKQFRF